MTDKADELLGMARQRFGKLTRAEIKFFKAVANSQFADYQVGDKKKNDPAQGDQWGKPRTLQADRIEWLCTDNEAREFVSHRGIQIRGAKIEGHLDLMFAQIDSPITFFSCRVLVPMNFMRSKVGGLFFNGSHIAGLAADGLTAEGNINLRDGFHSEGEVRLLGANIGGSLICSKGHFQNPEGFALSADGLKVEGDVNLQDGFHAEGEVRLLGASIGGSLDCRDGHFQNPEGFALSADGLKVEGDVNLRDAFHAEGVVRLLGTSIDGDLDCSNGSFQNPKGDALIADRLKVEGSINLQDAFHAEGVVRLPGTFIGGDLDCSNGRFQNPKGDALIADCLQVKGSVNLRDGFHSKGEVRLLGASIGTDLDCCGGRFAKTKGDALCLEGTEINGSLFIRTGQDKAGREVKPVMRGRIGLIRTEVRGGFQWRDIEVSEETVLDLRHANIGVFFDEPSSWPNEGNLLLDGFNYERIEGLESGDAKARIEWIKRSQPGHFTPQPYEQLAKVFRENGFEEDARDVLIAKNDSYIKNAFMSFWAKLRRRIFGWILGYGYRPWKAVWWLLGFWGIGTGLFWFGRCVEVIQPTRSVPYPDFIAPVYSLDLFIPLINLHQATYWLPDAQNLWGILLLIYFCVHIVLGWILMTMFIFGLTGLLKR